jgi:hypothetical protein
MTTMIKTIGRRALLAALAPAMTALGACSRNHRLPVHTGAWRRTSNRQPTRRHIARNARGRDQAVHQPIERRPRQREPVPRPSRTDRRDHQTAPRLHVIPQRSRQRHSIPNSLCTLSAPRQRCVTS